MRPSTSLLLVAALFVLPLGRVATLAAEAPPPRSLVAFDADWRFLLGDPADAQSPEFADASWRTVVLPHDWSIAGPFGPDHPTTGSGAFLPSGVAWYRKSFTLPANAQGRRVFIEFDGVMQNSDVWINGAHLGHRPYGYVSFRYELTDHLQSGPGAINIVAVRTDTAQQPASRWYSGAGIYRHVRLLITAPVHVEPWSTFVTTENPGAPGQPARVRTRTRVVNQSPAPRSVGIEVAITNPAGATVATTQAAPQTIVPGAGADFDVELAASNPQLWDLANPRLYHAVVRVRDAGTTLDTDEVTFGIRDAHFDSERGFLLNGKPVRLYGACLHHDGGAFGAAVPLAVWQQRLEALRALGVNSIRTAHNPPDPGFLDLCDRLGFLVMDELFDCWTVGKNPYDYHLHFNAWSKTDVRDTVLRDRNHPSIILYSAGNEIHDTPKEELAKQILAGLVATFHEFDPTRAVTQALFRPNVSHDYTNGLADLLDVIGTNYRDRELLAAWRDKPGRKIVGTEQRHDRDTWLALRDNPQEAGQFLWTGIDYLGESRAWPMIGNPSGLIDRAGIVKPVGRERQSWWGHTPMVALTRRVAPTVVSKYDPGYEPANAPLRRTQVLFPDWTPANREPHDEKVEVYSNGEDVELFLNGRSLGAKPINADASPRVWTVPYEPGVIRAVARQGGKDVATDELKTAGKPAQIVVTADRSAVSSSWEDVVRLTASVVDEHGVLVPNAADLVSFTVDGPGNIVAVDNGDNASHESFQATQRHAYQGHAVAFVRASGASGRFTVRAAAEGLAAGEATLTVASPR